MDKEKIIEKLTQDEHYYGDYGKQFLSNSDINILLINPKLLHQQKGMQTAQQFGAASSYGKKYALGNLFLIDDTADADSTNSHGKASQIVNKHVKASIMTEDQLKKAVEFVKGGGAITAIESKYTITPEQMKTLKNGVNG